MRKFKVGDLVRIKPYCVNGGEFAVVVESPNVINCVKVVLMGAGKVISSLVSNLEVVYEEEQV